MTEENSNDDDEILTMLSDAKIINMDTTLSQIQEVMLATKKKKGGGRIEYIFTKKKGTFVIMKPKPEETETPETQNN